MGVVLNMFKTMMWKNCIVRKRHWLVTILEAAIPCAVFGLLLYIRLDVANEAHDFNSTAYYPTSFSGDDCFGNPGMYSGSEYVVVFSPNSAFTNEIMTETRKRIWTDATRIGLEHKNFMGSYLKEFKAVASENDMEEYFLNYMVNDTRTLFYGIVFNDRDPNKFEYKIRIGNFQGSFFTDRSLPPIVFPGRGQSGANYKIYCFLTLQKTLDSVYIEKISNKSLGRNIMMSEFPYPAFSGKDLEFQMMMSLFLPMIILFSFSIILPNVIKRVVEEKETGVKELMKMMGLRPWMVWVGWLLNANMVNIFVSTISTVMLTGHFKSDVPPVLPYTNPVLLWLLLILFMNSVTVFLFVICAFLHRPLIASSIGMFLYFIPQFATQIDVVQENMSFWFKLAFCLMPTLGLREGLQIIFAFNSRAIGVQFYNLFKSATDDKNDLSLGVVLVMMIFDIILYGLITMYVDCVRPGPYGRARPWYFIFTMFFRKNDDGVLIADNDDDDNDPVHFENPPAHLNVGLSVRNLTKVFPPHVPAVNGVNIDIYKGQITALLGHNGAGKTTTMSILTGLFSPTSGTVHQYVSDTKCINIFENMDQFRQDLGLCPQHNMLFSYFTVMEHLLFFGMLKGMTVEKARKDGRQLLQTLNIIDKANVTCDKLSGGMKRKLSLAISLIASPKVLMLDEPTSGMDPESRREMWDILLNIREGRTIIITTHFMEEADVLGDRIAIMDHGKVRCYGTTMFLKKVYGAGYNMTLLTTPSADMKRITDLVTNSVAGSKLRTYAQGQLVYNLPSESTSTFAPLFAEIERRKAELNVTSVGVSCTTMEEVFLKVGEISEMERAQEMDKNSNDSHENNFTKTSSTEHLSPKRVSGLQLILQQFHLLLLKKVKFTYRKIWSYVFFTLLAVLMVGVAVKSASQDSADSLVPSLKIDMNLYAGLDIFVTYKDQPEMKKIIDIYEELVPASKVNELPNGNITTELLKVGNENIERYRLKVMAAADWIANNVTSFYSSIGTHSAPASLNLVTNTLLKLYKKDASIVVYNHPFSEESLSPCTSGGPAMEKYMVGLKWLMTVPFGMLFVVANYIAFPLQERVSSAKHLQLMTGLSPIVYWLSAFLWDYLLFMFTSFLLIIPIFFLDHLEMVSHSYEIGVLLLIINLYGLSGIPFAYFFSFLKKSPAGASSSFIFYNIIFGIAGAVAIVVIGALSILSGFLEKVLNGVLMLNPFYCVALVFYKFSLAAYEKAMCNLCKHDSELCGNDKSYLSFESKDNPNGIGLLLTVLSLDWILYFAIILLIDYGLMAKFSSLLKSCFVKHGDVVDLDSDVRDELDRVDAARTNQGSMSTVLMVDDLKKTYGINFTAVRGVSFAVNSGECFGLLGVNGAGKTTTFKMLTGDEVPTAGNATIARYSLLNDRSKYLAQIGYCPQFDAINELMTGREMLNLFGQLRGINPEDSNHLTNYWLKFLGLDEYSDRLCGTYSGGNKRKLSTAMALIGDPVIVFLDEPTSGVDPVARRKLWNVLARCQKAGQSIVLTSHSMDECEALCNRLTIMVKGQLVCLGNIQYLKQRFGQGFTIMVKLHSVDCNDVVLRQLKQDIETTFAPDCMLKDEHKGLLHYHVTDTSKPWSTLFQSMDEIKRRHALVEDYTVSETTLEQVFISFAKRQ